jgi:hypothetical protein
MKAAHLLVVLPLLSACGVLSAGDSNPCLPPPGFEEADLVGTWTSVENLENRSDTLILREDGFFKQIINIEEPEFHFESDWLPWRVEYAENGVVYVHLTGMRLYAFAPHLIGQEVVGGDGGTFLDFCQGAVLMPDGKEVFPGVTMPPGEGVLTVMSVSSQFVQPRRGIYLALLPVSETAGWSYQLQDD